MTCYLKSKYVPALKSPTDLTKLAPFVLYSAELADPGSYGLKNHIGFIVPGDKGITKESTFVILSGGLYRKLAWNLLRHYKSFTPWSGTLEATFSDSYL